MHPVVQQALSYGERSICHAWFACDSPESTQRVEGYGETYGEDRVKSAFQTYLDILDLNPSQLKATNEVVGDYLDFLTNERQPTDDENSGECLPNTRGSL